MKDIKIPYPGSEEAQDLGCLCPVMDNNYGEGYMGMEGVFVYSTACPLHTDALTEVMSEDKEH